MENNSESKELLKKIEELQVQISVLEKSEAELKKALREIDTNLRTSLQESERSRRLIMDAVPAMISYVDKDLYYRFVNHQYEKWFHRPATEIVGKRIKDMLGEEQYQFIEHHIEAVLRGERVVYERQILFEREKRDVRVNLVPHFEDGGAVTGFFILINDITDLKKMEETIKHQASHDELTGLANRALFADRFRHAAAEARRNNKRLGLMFLDLDRFKVINDTLGHDTGDELLKQAGARLTACTRRSDTVARIGGDEFNILVTGIARAEDTLPIIKKIRGSFEQPFLIKGQVLHVTASIGISIYPDDGQDLETLLKYADVAMYHAKEKGGNDHQFYSAAINIRTLERLRLENQLRQAMERKELRLHYQSQKDIDTGRIVCTEALLRWQHPELGMLRPEQFMFIAEETGLIVPIGEWILRTACAQNKAWQDAGYPSFCISINLSGRQFHQADLSDITLQILEQAGLDPQWLEFEIAETTAMSDIDFTVSSMKKLAERGVRFTLDDFGIGCSSLNYLKQLPIQKLKIDKSFIEDIPHDPDHRAIVRAVIAMSHSLRLKAIAEGVETEEQLAFLRSNNCDQMQGYLINQPLPEEKFTQVIAGYK